MNCSYTVTKMNAGQIRSILEEVAQADPKPNLLPLASCAKLLALTDLNLMPKNEPSYTLANVTAWYANAHKQLASSGQLHILDTISRQKMQQLNSADDLAWRQLAALGVHVDQDPKFLGPETPKIDRATDMVLNRGDMTHPSFS